MVLLDGFWAGFFTGFLVFAFILCCMGLYNGYRHDLMQTELQEKILDLMEREGSDVSEDEKGE